MNAFPLLPRKTVLAVARIAASITLSQRASFAFSAEAQQMCSGDAFRLCPSEIPNVPAITACTIRKRVAQPELPRGARPRGRQKNGKVADGD